MKKLAFLGLFITLVLGSQSLFAEGSNPFNEVATITIQSDRGTDPYAPTGGTSTDPYAATTSKKVNINTAGRAELARLPGIGPDLADKIISYRNYNGPFQTPQDIKKINGIGDGKYKVIKNLIIVSTPLIDINTASREELAELPGIGPVIADQIVLFRQQNGLFRTTQDIMRVYGIKQAKFNAIRNLITVSYSGSSTDPYAPSHPTTSGSDPYATTKPSNSSSDPYATTKPTKPAKPNTDPYGTIKSGNSSSDPYSSTQPSTAKSDPYGSTKQKPSSTDPY
ncbi:MAG: helix-hairpin-helix domain-containing protein [Candidatus Riflebacteria bacterium]|nr:helix-hairpin-helix domain-containing protein [Candidatus Riflebacteria bacterium]